MYKVASLHRVGEAALFLFLLVTGSSVALLNGFPTVYFDTGTYVVASFSYGVPIDRPVFYSLFIWCSRLLIHSLWSTVLLQSAVTAAVLMVFLQKEVAGAFLTFRSRVAIGLVLGIGSSLPWFASQLMPDIFTGIVGLSFFIILFKWAGLSRWAKLLVAGAFVLSTLVHSSHWIFVALLLALAGVPILAKKRGGVLPGFVPAVALFLVVLFVIPVTNFRYTRRLFYSETGHVFLLGRMIGDGLIQKLLADHCQETSYLLCPFKDQVLALKGDDYLWSDKSPIKTVGWTESAAGSWQMIRDSLWFYPLKNLLAAGKGTVRQIAHFETGDFLQSYIKEDFVRQAVNRYPGEYAVFMAASQQSGELLTIVERVRPFHRAVAIVSIIAALLLWTFVRLLRYGHPKWERIDISFLGFSLCAVVLNAFVCASLSTVNNRYQSRVIWLVVLAVTTSALNTWGARGKSAETHQRVEKEASARISA